MEHAGTIVGSEPHSQAVVVVDGRASVRMAMSSSVGDGEAVPAKRTRRGDATRRTTVRVPAYRVTSAALTAPVSSGAATERADERADRGDGDQRDEPHAAHLHREERVRHTPSPPSADDQLAAATMSPAVAVRARSNRAATSDQFTMFQKAFT